MPTFGRVGTGKWHLVGEEGCRYGENIADGATTPDETVTATDIVAYDPPTETNPNISAVSISRSLGGSSFPRGHSDNQQLVLPEAISESESELCESCRKTLERHQKRRSRLIAGLKLVTPHRDIEWTVETCETPRVCDWCRAREPTTWHSDVFRATVCPACGRLFETPLGEPADEHVPDRNLLPPTPSDPVEPIAFGTTFPDYDPTELVGSNRPLLKYREKTKYAELVCELERTGHGFSTEGIDALARVRSDYAATVADNNDHQADVTLSVGRTPRTVTIEGIFPADRESVLADCWAIVSDPDYWIPLGWPQQGYIHRRGRDPSIPGNDAVVETFPRLETQSPSSSVDTEALKTRTEAGRYNRGQRYYKSGAVTDIEVVDDRLQATVQGSQPYDVEVTLPDGRYERGRCSCPDDAVPCKHIVAAVLASGDVDPTGSEQSLSAILEASSPEDLRELLADLADEDVSVRKRIYEELHQSDS